MHLTAAPTRETVDRFVFWLERCETVHHDGSDGDDVSDDDGDDDDD